MLGKGQSGGFPVEVSGDSVQSPSIGSVDNFGKKSLHINSQLTGNVAQATPQQNQLLLTPASLQLAQLQAQLTLQRLKLAQGGSPTSSAVLNQVLSNVAMSQPLLSHLRASAMVANPQSTFTSGVLGFPTSSFSTLATGVFNQSSNCLQSSLPMRGAAVPQQTADYGKKEAYPFDTDRRTPYNLIGATSGEGPADRQYSLTNTQVKNTSHFQTDLYGQDIQGQPTGFSPHEQNAYNSTVKGDPWKSTVNASGNCEVSNNGSVWTTSGQVLRSRTDLYNPEEPTSDRKFTSSGLQRFGGYPTLHGSEDLKTLQPHQVNDYYAVTPSQLPHQCSICDKKVYNLKDWEQHVKGKLHLQNKTQYASESSALASNGAVHYAVGRPPNTPLSSGQTNSMVFTTSGQDGSSGGITSFVPAAAMKTYPTSDTTLTSLQHDTKCFPPRKGIVSRVVHICNLPEGSCTENDVINLGLPFGKVTNYILMRSTHQAFLEMAYVEAAQAMVQYYQLTPATINDHKLLIRMSKRYKELQLKKPGKDVETIIQDIASQRGRDEAQEQEHYMPERARSRSPVGRSLSPGFSCDAPEGPQGPLCRGVERGTNGLVSQRSPWEWSSLSRRDEREGPWQNGESMEDDRPNGWGSDRRKTYQKVTDMNMRCVEERGGSRDWLPQRMLYRNMEDSFYTKEPNYKTDKPPRPPYQRHDKSKRRDGDYHRSRYSDPDTTESIRAEDKRSSPERGRSRRFSRKHSSAERHSKEHNTEQTEQRPKERSATPQRSTSPKESNNSEKLESQREVENTEDTDDEIWYPKNMEELVTVDEVGGEDDIIEPDLPYIEECADAPLKQSVDTGKSDSVPEALQVTDIKETQTEERSRGQVEPTQRLERSDSTQCPQELKLNTRVIKDLNNFQRDFNALREQTCSDDYDIRNGVLQKPTESYAVTIEEAKLQGNETTLNGAQYPQDNEALSSLCDQDKAVSEHSIPLGVEFIVPQSGFYCKLCGLFYSSEETAKAAHCRSVVHYRNLQKYLSQLAEESIVDKFSSSSL